MRWQKSWQLRAGTAKISGLTVAHASVVHRCCWRLFSASKGSLQSALFD
jgi:hypothetical protein